MYNISVIKNGVSHVIPESDVIKVQRRDSETISFNFTNMISATMSVILDNAEHKYDDDYEGTLFYSGWYDATLLISDELDDVIWRGRIKNIEKSTNAQLVVKSANFIKEIVDADCSISYGVETDITPAKIIYYLLTSIVNIPEEFLKLKTFEDADDIQTENSCFVEIKYSEESTKKCGSIIKELCRLTSSYLYIENDIIRYHQDRLYTGVLGEHVRESDIREAGYKTEYYTDDISNNYYIAYKNVTAVAYANPGTIEDYIQESRDAYGSKTFRVPDDDMDSALAADFRILLKTQAGAAWCGSCKIERNHQFLQLATIELNGEKQYIPLNSQIDLTYNSFSREPLRVIEKKPDKDNNRVTMKCLFLNKPYRFIDRDITPPVPVEIVKACFLDEDTVRIWFFPSVSSDATRYELEIGEHEGFYDEITSQGLSPVILDPEEDVILYYADISGLVKNQYYMRIICYDNKMNESLPSNVFSVLRVEDAEDYESRYRIDGDVFLGVSSLLNRQTGDVLPEEFVRYDDVNYSDGVYGYHSVYYSRPFGSAKGFDTLKFKAGTLYLQKVYIQYRELLNGVFQAWSGVFSSDNIIMVKCNGERRIQLRYLIGGNDINITLKEVREVA
ncbi:MAG: hypothetical protein CVV44_20385 [Spirochaetae bacterium HGW-Spirochaetae-1]|jgi:hypothetical protein|nr:MAG: hypothetical protein CVV44_20385 [Spirochaetae bacterium HGW-Spirochaetae-1]